MFSIYFQEGFKHLIQQGAYDHIAFLIALTAGFTFRKLKPLLILITAFTIGHSLTLALAALDRIVFPSSIIEFLIPVTILIMAIYQFFSTSSEQPLSKISYLITFIFGLIHGSGFSNQFKAIMGKTANITEPLIGFNLGVEAAQILIVSIVLLLTYLITNLIGVKPKIWKTILIIFAILISIVLIKQTWPF